MKLSVQVGRHPWKKTRRAGFVALIGMILTFGLAAPAMATITPSSTALTIAQAIASSSVTVTGASFVASPPNGTPNGVSTSALGGFPLDGADYGILTSGNVGSVDQPGTLANTNDGGSSVRGDTALDVSILKIDLMVPQGANCLTIDFKFLSEEYPEFVGSSYSDAFIAELDTSDWTTAGSSISAPHNFAFDPSNGVVSVNSTGLGGMSPANGMGTAFDGLAGPGPDPWGAATLLVEARTPVTAGTHSVYLSIFDQVDNALDSAVFLDNLRIASVPNPSTDCRSGATQPAHLTLAKLVSGGTAVPADWTLSATGPSTISGVTGAPAITDAPVGAGTYVLAETGPTGYSPGAWSCSGGNLTGASLVLAAGETASCSITNTFNAFLERGAFVIGDDGAKLNATVTWWSSSWANSNTLSGGSAPDSFKGFAVTLDPTPPRVGGTWSTGPGGSPKPPMTVPTYMAVIVTSSVTQQGSSISGDIVQIVLVKNGSTFGTGTIVAILSQ